MFSMQFTVELRRSTWMLAYLVAVHCLIVFALFQFVAGAVLTLLTGVLVLCLLVFNLHRYANVQSRQWVQRMSYRDQLWSLSTASGEHAVSLNQATVWQCLIVLNFYDALQQRHYRLSLLPDSCTKEQLRQLRVIIKHLVTWR